MTRPTLHGKVAERVSRIATRAAGPGHRTRAARDPAPSEHRKLQARYDARCAELETADRRRAELFSLLAHDLKNPLSPLLISTQVLGRTIPEGHAARRSVDIIRRSADEVSAAIEELSDAASIDLGRLAVHSHLAPADAGEMIAAVVAATSRRLQERHLKVAVAGGLPPVVCDRHRVVRLLVDLVTRALRVTPRGDTVTIRAEPDDEGATLITVTDAGPAVREAYLGVFFDLPVDAAHQRATGQELAISLYVARGVIEAHGGWIELEAEAEGERGNTVRLMLPSAETPG